MKVIRDQLKNEIVSGENGAGALFSFEGRVANLYWSAIKILIGDKPEFSGRIGRGAKDLVNVLLNYGYSILFSRVETSVLSCGFLPFAGFLHADRPGKPSFVLDVMELFRQPIVDYAVIMFLQSRENADRTVDRDLLRDFARHIQDRLAEKVISGDGKRYTREYRRMPKRSFSK